MLITESDDRCDGVRRLSLTFDFAELGLDTLLHRGLWLSSLPGAARPEN